MGRRIYTNPRPVMDWMSGAPSKESFDFLEVWKVHLSLSDAKKILRFPHGEVRRFTERLVDGARIPKRTRDLVPWIHAVIKHNPSYNIAKSSIFWNLIARPGVLQKIADDVFQWGVAMCEYGDYRSGTIFLYRVWESHGNRIETQTLQWWLDSAISTHDHGSGFLFVAMLERLRTPNRHLLNNHGLRQVVVLLEKAASGPFNADFFLARLFLEIAREEIAPSSYARLIELYQTEVRRHAETHIEGSVKIVDEVARRPKKKRGADPV